MIPIVAVGAIIRDAQGRLLVVERGQPPGEGLWSLPGGKLEPHETLAQAVAREVREETGLVVEIGTLACVVERIDPSDGTDPERGFASEPVPLGRHFVILDYYARVIGGSLRPATDVRAARFVDDAELATLPVTDGLVEVVTSARAKQPPWH